MGEMEHIDYLCIGHVTRDLTPNGPSVGGTVTYRGLTARALGQRVAVVTSAEPTYDLSQALPDISVARVPAEATTTFENRYGVPGAGGFGRRQVIHGVANRLEAGAVPPRWRRARIVHLGPVANEVSPDLVGLFDDGFVGLTPQGWHRRWGATGQVSLTRWAAAAQVLPLASAVVVSQEDMPDDESLAIYQDRCRVLVVTSGADGCTVHYGGEWRHFPAPAVPEVDPTGVGDIFAAAFFIRFRETGGTPWEAARFVLGGADRDGQDLCAGKPKGRGRQDHHRHQPGRLPGRERAAGPGH